MLVALKLDDRSCKDILYSSEGIVMNTALRLYGTINDVAKHFQMTRSTIFRKEQELKR